jgi:hypothetical protein
MIIFSASSSSSSSSFHQTYNYKIKKGRREKTRERNNNNNNTRQDVFKNERRKAASVTINEKINEDKIQYIAIYRFFYVCVPKSSAAESLSKQQ